ncbi:classical arabinogalactan protein 1 [Lathyrus oleraceus]|uniref:Uncharacterized protein n=1 Tax=Pisum sativum TaxID=3888 RepID=A0A9D5BQZ3_PEA|nr:classical arabinogalactan protein 1-like [Pisum sativum]KAI5448348.1 hypothetical protein KIW84_015682 [Pisum sativum]
MSHLAFMFVAALLLTTTMAQSPASSPIKSKSPRKVISPSPAAVTPPPASSPATGGSSPEHSPSPSAISPSSISGPPSEAPGPASSGVVLNRVSVAVGSAVLIFVAALIL